ncbi:DUF4179 domain-containing protein [Brevibacillus laterosporus]|uniref:DUF4179 domain-containing protein n=1 Tax=Brevibacillus laterosporus TaxID=1465 RepID=UPI003D1F7D77
MDIDQELKEFQYSDKGPILSELTFTHEMKNHVREKMIMTSKPKRRIWYWTSSFAGLLIILLAITGMPSADTIKNLFPTLTNTPRISAFEEYGDDKELKDFHEKGLTVPYHVSKTDQGVTVTITDLFFDGHQLDIGYLVQMPPEKDPKRELLSDYLADFRNFTLNGESFGINGSNDVKQIGEHLYVGIDSMYIDEKAPNDFKFHAQVERVGLVGGSGKWQWDLEFKMPDSVKALQRTVPIHFETNWKGYQFKVESMRTIATQSSLLFKVKRPKEKQEELVFSFYDQYMTYIGSDVYFSHPKRDSSEQLVSLPYIKQEEPFLYIVPSVLEERGSKNKKKTKAEKKLPKYTEIDLSQPLPYVLSEQQGDFILKNVDFLSNKTVIHYEVKNPFNQYRFLRIIDEKDNVYISLSGTDARREFTDSYSFMEEFPPFTSQKNLKLVVPTDVMDKEEQKIREQNLIKIPLF